MYLLFIARIRLNKQIFLITCKGFWDEASNSYKKLWRGNNIWKYKIFSRFVLAQLTVMRHFVGFYCLTTVSIYYILQKEKLYLLLHREFDHILNRQIFTVRKWTCWTFWLNFNEKRARIKKICSSSTRYYEVYYISFVLLIIICWNELFTLILYGDMFYFVLIFVSIARI